VSNIQYQDQIEDDALSPAVRAQLKWFNSAKGFGFVIPEDNPADAFLHITQLQKIGVHGLGEGAIILCHIDYGPKGATVTKVDQVIDAGIMPTDTIEYDPENASNVRCKGIVKWYKPDKGFGFIIPDDGMKDIFVHQSCLDRAQIPELRAGQRVRITFKSVDKGREAVTVEIEDNP
jgi:CspA family cold shock protein